MKQAAAEWEDAASNPKNSGEVEDAGAGAALDQHRVAEALLLVAPSQADFDHDRRRAHGVVKEKGSKKLFFRKK